jgi:inorganic pyrophosphatase
MIRVLIQAEAGRCDQKIYNERTLQHLHTRHRPRPYPYPYGFVLETHAPDGDCVDCYLITHEPVRGGTIVECEPVGLLWQDENGEADHKVLAAIPGQQIELGQELLEELQEFITAMFAADPGACVRVGPILPREAALRHLEASWSV